MSLFEIIIHLDKELFLLINSFHNSSFDHIMLIISEKLTWVPLYLGIVFYIFRNFKLKKASLIFLALIFVVTLADQTSVHLFKNVFLRLRPCFDSEISDLVHYINPPGGKYGFVSSHAANSFAFAFLSSLIFKNKLYTILIFIWAFIVSYSRIYLGVHYPGDIIGGAVLGILLSLPVYIIFKAFLNKQIRTVNSFDNSI